MADKTSIEWTDASWTPIRARHKATGKVGWHCEHVTPGCEHCYSEGMNKRLGTGLPFKPGHRKDIELFLDENMLTQPLRWKKPRMIFVCSMTDLFADFVPDEWIDRVFAVMALCPQHIFQVLTKRSKRMREYVWSGKAVAVAREAFDMTCRAIRANSKSIVGSDFILTGHIAHWRYWPLPNVWLGVSCEDQARADERIPDLLATPAAVRFVSAEPLIGPIYFKSSLRPTCDRCPPWEVPCIVNCKHVSRLDWIIVGGESGPGARPMQVEWAENIMQQCKDAGTAFFMKQMWGPVKAKMPPIPKHLMVREMPGVTG